MAELIAFMDKSTACANDTQPTTVHQGNDANASIQSPKVT